jgi:hypothetical protein
MKSLDRARLASLMQREQKRFTDERPKSKALFERAGKSLLAGVPMNWMRKWAGAFPPFVREAQGAYFYDVDGHRYIDFCLGDTGAMTGHSPFATVKAAEEQMKRGITLMLPGEDAILSPKNCSGVLGSPTGNSRLRPRTPTAFRFAWRGRLQDVPRFSFSIGVITARWMKVSSLCRLMGPPARAAGI